MVATKEYILGKVYKYLCFEGLQKSADVLLNNAQSSGYKINTEKVGVESVTLEDFFENEDLIKKDEEANKKIEIKDSSDSSSKSESDSSNDSSSDEDSDDE
ncbi:hypothetical protein C6P40_004614, partial [Pichia californica]